MATIDVLKNVLPQLSNDEILSLDFEDKVDLIKEKLCLNVLINDKDWKVRFEAEKQLKKRK